MSGKQKKDAPEADERLDLSGVPCPHNTAQAAMKLLLMDEGELLEIIIDDGEPKKNVPFSLEFEGHEIVRMEQIDSQWRLLVRRGDV